MNVSTSQERVQESFGTSPSAPDCLREAWADAKRRGLDKLTMEEINAEIGDYRREKRSAAGAAAK
jgi:hypothetical protein